MDAGFNVDTISLDGSVSSLQASGYHRTSNEVAGKGSQGQLSYGGSLAFSTDKFHVGANAVHYDFEHTIAKADYLYNKFGLSGKRAAIIAWIIAILTKTCIFLVRPLWMKVWIRPLLTDY